MIRDLGNIGSNINQISKALHHYVLKNKLDAHDPQHILAIFVNSNVQGLREDLAEIRKVLMKKI